MVKGIQNEYSPSEVSPPGETLRELLSEKGISQADLAKRMGRPIKTISEIIHGKTSITPVTALELELVLGTPADFWIARERDFRTHLARLAQLKRLKEDIAWAKRFPLRDMMKYKFIPESNDPAMLVKNLLEFFGVASARQWKKKFASYQVAYRKTAAFDADKYALSAWLRAGVARAERRQLGSFSRDAFLEVLKQARLMTLQPPESFVSELIDQCAETGVVFTLVPELPRSRASGATMWLAPDRALIQLSLRYKTDDHLWFTFFHEAAHVLFHQKRVIFLEGSRQSGKEEEEANRWAADFLIPSAEYETLKAKQMYSKDFIRSFASELGISPGIVVGRLQHDRLLSITHCNGLKRRFRWVVD